MKKVFNSIILIAALSTIVVAIAQLKSPQNTIEAKLVSRDLLTRPIEFNGLKSTYTYNEIDIKRLWQVRYVITNTGDKVIVGNGDRSNIINDDITLSLPSGYEILESNVSSNDFQLTHPENTLKLKFLQWKRKESIEIVVYLSQVIDTAPLPMLSVNEREIIDGRVIYSSLISNESEKHFLYEFLPVQLSATLKWIIILSNGFMLLVMIGLVIDSVKESNKYKKWRDDFGSDLNTFINDHGFPNDIKEWSQKHWEASGLTQPKLLKSNVKDTAIGAIIVSTLLFIPLLFVISI